jgi:hypothetical protein
MSSVGGLDPRSNLEGGTIDTEHALTPPPAKTNRRLCTHEGGGNI